MKKIELTLEKFALVDDEDFDRVNALKWCLKWSSKKKNCYAKNGTVGQMHRFILTCEASQLVDHINGDGLDNRRENLRLVSYSQNAMNRRKRSDCTSGVPGVNLIRGKWVARIQIEGKRKHLGRFSDQSEAVRAYREAQKSHFGEYAHSLGG